MIFSIIIPHRNSVELLSKLLSTIPNSSDCEILVVDNSPMQISKESIKTDRNINLLYSDPSRGAGGARNVGIENARGKWLIFADADDYFSQNAFDVFSSQKDSDADLIYTEMDGVYLDTGERSNRGDGYTKLVKRFLNREIPETDLRFKFFSPCCKMVSHDLVKRHNLRYDEVTASNDVFFSMQCGYYAKKIDAVDAVTYIATVSRGTLTKRGDYAVISARYGVNLRYNSFLRSHGYPEYQISILNFALRLCKMGIKPAWEALYLLFKYRQNPFIGYRNWLITIKQTHKSKKKDKKYIVK